MLSVVIGGRKCVSVAEPNRALCSLPRHREKFDELITKEKDVNEFMETFDSTFAQRSAELSAKQAEIVNLLNRIHKFASMSTDALPSANKFRELQVRERALCRPVHGSMAISANLQHRKELNQGIDHL